MELQEKNICASPTPIEKISLELNSNEFFMKRDDLLPFSFGGNKARKAIEFFEHIASGNYNAVVTYGSSSSNHCRVVANMARKYGLLCYIISPEEEYTDTINSRLVSILGAEIVKTPLNRVSDTINSLMLSLSNTCRPYFIQGGGHGNLGTHAYVKAYQEIVNYERTRGMKFDYIFHASGTGTTQAGLVCGAAISGDINRKIVGISIARRNPRGKTVVEESVKEYLTALKYSGEAPEIIFDDSYVLDGYGKYNAQILETVSEMFFKEGVPLNATYTGKAFWGMKEYILKNNLTNKNILFIHTGGAPLFFDDIMKNHNGN